MLLATFHSVLYYEFPFTNVIRIALELLLLSALGRRSSTRVPGIKLLRTYCSNEYLSLYLKQTVFSMKPED